MQTIAVIGCGAISESVARYLAEYEDVDIVATVIEPGMDARARELFGEHVEIAYDAGSLSAAVDLAVDCAGHPALKQHGEAFLSRGIDLVTVHYDRQIRISRMQKKA